MMRIGLISDTHGLLRPEALAFLDGCAHIIHAGDIGGTEIIARLRCIAPVTAVRGNNDNGAWANTTAETELARLGSISVYVIHDLAQLDIDPAAAGVQTVVSGHSHKPSVSRRGGVLYVNPGSAGRRRFALPISLGELQIDAAGVAPHLASLVAGHEAARFVRDA